MCGIVGIVGMKSGDPGLLERMNSMLIHRGPDGGSVWISKDKNVGLAHRRLSILDLSEAGTQPMSDESGNICITYNGEIYNYKEIKSELEKSGYIFRSETDTEVLLNAYKKWGTECLSRLNGMFAFAIYDSNQGHLFLARDRVGKKPLYYLNQSGRFVFASELKAILQDKSIVRDTDLNVLNQYLAFGYVPGDRSIFKGIGRLPPAHAILYDIKQLKEKVWRYWELPENKPDTVDVEDLSDELWDLINDATRIRMRSDVPLGAFLSGGVDSSLIVAAMAENASTPVQTFSIGFSDSKFSELKYAKIVAEHFGTDHTEFVVEPDSFSILPDLVDQFDEPFADQSMIPTYYVSRETKKSVTVTLSGDGGDEIFAGYSEYLGALGEYHLAKYIPPMMRRFISSTAEYFPDRIKGKRQLIRLKYSPEEAFIDRSEHLMFKPQQRAALFKKESMAEMGAGLSQAEVKRRSFFAGGNDLIYQITRADYNTYLPDDILVKVDRASMLCSLEVRAPILDYRIAEFSFGKVPSSLKIKGMEKKYLLKYLANKHLPQELDIKRKQGFSVPIAEWFRGPLYQQIKEILLDANYEHLNKKYIEQILEAHREGYDHSGRLFSLLVLALWLKKLN